MTEFTGFTKDHVGCVVTDAKNDTQDVGKIVRFNKDERYPVMVKIGQTTRCFREDGFYSVKCVWRRLYFGDKIKIEVSGERIPEPKLICPVCGVEHEFVTPNDSHEVYFESNPLCPFSYAVFEDYKVATVAMKNLITAMKRKES